MMVVIFSRTIAQSQGKEKVSEERSRIAMKFHNKIAQFFHFMHFPSFPCELFARLSHCMIVKSYSLNRIFLISLFPLFDRHQRIDIQIEKMLVIACTQSMKNVKRAFQCLS